MTRKNIVNVNLKKGYEQQDKALKSAWGPWKGVQERKDQNQTIVMWGESENE